MRTSAQPPPWRKKPTPREHPFQAWRVWRITTARGVWWGPRNPDRKDAAWLTSVGVCHVWPGPVCRAIVPPYDTRVWDEIKPRIKNGEASAEDLQTQAAIWNGGIYSLNSVQNAAEAALLYRAVVLGLIDIWGRVVAFQLGYRSEIAMVRKLALLMPNDYSWAIPHLERNYHCDVVSLKELVGEESMFFERME